MLVSWHLWWLNVPICSSFVGPIHMQYIQSCIQIFHNKLRIKNLDQWIFYQAGVYQQLRAFLKCRVCHHDYGDAEVLTCSRDHWICSRCYRSNSTCPECGENMQSSQPRRCRTSEKVLKLIQALEPPRRWNRETILHCNLELSTSQKIAKCIWCIINAKIDIHDMIYSVVEAYLWWQKFATFCPKWCFISYDILYWLHELTFLGRTFSISLLLQTSLSK